jgi:hypothetical protein
MKIKGVSAQAMILTAIYAVACAIAAIILGAILTGCGSF